MLRVLLSTAALVTLAALAFGQAPPGTSNTMTAITVEELHCAGCAKRIGTALYKVSGVATVQYDLKAKTLWVTPRPGQQPSPRGLWEAVEQAGDQPTRLHGPAGAFTTKPQS